MWRASRANSACAQIRWIDYLALVGDASDNVPGVRGIGPKGAQKLLSDYETLDKIYLHIDEIKGAVQKKLIEGKDKAFLSRKLCTIVCDVDLGVQFADLHIQPANTEPLRTLLRDLGFNSFEKKFFAGETASEKPLAAAESTAPASTSTPSAKPRSRKTSGANAQAQWNEEEWSVEQLKEKVEPLLGNLGSAQ